MDAIESRAEKKYAYSVIIARIDEMIRTGALAPGDRLPPERQLAQAFGVSRASLTTLPGGRVKGEHHEC